MTGPATEGSEWGTGAPLRSTGTQGAVGAILIVLALGLALRSIIAYLIPGSGFGVDLGAFQFWASDLASHGLHGFYQRDFFHDYTPGYLYVLWLVGTVAAFLGGGVGDLIKIPPVLADLAIGWLVWSMVRELGGRDRLALLAGFVAVMNPISWFDSVVWGQVDSFGVVFLLLGLRALWRDQPERSAVFTVLAAIIKPQLGILIPLVAVITIRRALWPVQPVGSGATTGATDSRRSVVGRIRAWEARTGSPWRILTTGLVGYLTAIALCLPFGLTVLALSGSAPFLTSGLVDQIALAGGGYPYLTVNAYNAWALVPGDTGASLANGGQWVCDAAATAAQKCGSGVAMFGAVPAVVVGAALLVLGIVAVLVVAARHPDRLTLLVALALLALAFFALPTRVHERYGYPFFALGAILFAISARWRIAYLALSAATFLNMYVVLTTLYPDNPSVADWLGIGDAVRSSTGVAAIAIVHSGAAIWAFLQLRADARDRLARELPTAAGRTDAALGASRRRRSMAVLRDRLGWGTDPIDDGVVGAAASRRDQTVGGPAQVVSRYVLPAWSARRSFADTGVSGWLRDRLRERPIRADRSRLLRTEGGGRFDRLDAFVLVALVVASLGLRTFRLAEPYQMHFDEVYHARTATEFLQSWRYSESHDIYEWTHPHLAKYAMAAGLVLWGEDHVDATGTVGVPIKAVVVEGRREDPLTGGRAGERVHVATGAAIRTDDLRTRSMVSTIPAAGASALAIDDTKQRLVIGYDDGRIGLLDLAAIGLGGTDVALQPEIVATLDHPVSHVLVSADGTTLVATSGARLSTLDLATGKVTGKLDLAGIADLSEAGTGASILATPGDDVDRAAVAKTLVALLGGTAADYEGRLTATPGSDGRVVIGAPGNKDKRAKVEAAITDGRLAGLEIVDLPRVAVATSAGLSFIDPASAAVTSAVALDGGAHGLTMVVGIDDPKLYVTSGTATKPTYDLVAVGGDPAADGPVSLGAHPLPGLGSRVLYDEASQQVHILGLVPGDRAGSAVAPWTVYVVEPHGNAVYADAVLPASMRPAGWAPDLEPQYPSEDRQELIVYGTDGATASIHVGSHAFAWRLPGVIAGALMAGVLYLLARILFRRRLVAGLVAAFVLLDGMLFVQSRIGMNDVYVGLFIMAAYTLFAAIWTGWWRARLASWLAMPVIGLLLGLALASKWVAAYAIGALLFLLLVRSALGRVLGIIGLIGISTVLGYLAVRVPEGQGFGNLAFLLIMIGLTLLAVVVTVLHPIAWSDEERWLALAAPAGLGVALFFGALGLGRLQTPITLGSVSITPFLVALLLVSASVLVYAVFRLGYRLGFGPMARLPLERSWRDPEAPAEPPVGWLRPGWMVGLPMVWAIACLVAVPLVVYVVSYIPWALVENHQLWANVPAGHSGQTLVELTGQMYEYHNGLTAPHPASSPWWAWPLDLKPVWFYQDGFAGSTSAAVYDAGNLVIWWLGVPAMIFTSVMAYRRRSLALALIAIGFAGQWIPWSRIDRAAFQYHYYTSLPFVILGLAYFVAELWHGPSRRTWAAARIVGGLAIMGPALLWLLSRPLCGLVGVESVNPGSQACPAVIPDAVLTVRSLGLLLVVGLGAWILGRGLLALSGDRADPPPDALRRLVVSAVGVALGFAAVALLPNVAILTLTSLVVEPIALLVGLAVAVLAVQVVIARDARRFAIGTVLAAAAWFVVWYPNIAALPLPSNVVSAYQGFIPTYLYAFQFPVGKADRNVAAPLLSLNLVILGIALTGTCLVVAYSAWSWRVAAAASAARTCGPSSEPPSDSLARTGGGG